MALNQLSAPQYITLVLAVLLIVRLLSLQRRRKVYRVFVILLTFESIESIYAAITYTSLVRYLPDYRSTWIGGRLVYWVLSFWIVYALLAEMLTTLPGISRFSKWALNSLFVLSIVGALLTAPAEYARALQTSAAPSPIDRALTMTFVLERTFSMAAILALLFILAFIVWFPVKMPRNLAVLSAGFIGYFGAKTGLVLLRDYWPNLTTKEITLLSLTVTYIVIACFASWILLINRRGEVSEVRLGHGWEQSEQTRLIGQLDDMNAALLRVARRRGSVTQ